MAALRRDAVAVANPRHDLISPALDYGGAPAPALTRPTAGAADEAALLRELLGGKRPLCGVDAATARRLMVSLTLPPGAPCRCCGAGGSLRTCARCRRTPRRGDLAARGVGVLGTLSEGLRDGDGAPDVAKAKALDAPPAPWGRRERLWGLASVALLAILSKIAGNALIYLYAAGEVKTGARHAVQTACGVSDVDFAILVGYCPGAATVLAGLALSLVRPLPADASALRDAALAGTLASGLGLAGLALAESVAALFAAQFAIGCGFTLVTVAATTFVGVAFIGAPKDSAVGHAAATGLILASEPIGSAAAVLLQYPALYASWRLAAAAGGGACVVLALAAAALFPRGAARGGARPRRSAAGPPRARRRAPRPHGAWLLAAYVAFHAAMDVKATYLTAYFDDAWPARASETATLGAAKGRELPNLKGSSLGRFPPVSADFWTSDHLSERSRRVDACSGTRARGTLTLKRT
ncbi:hypothetical protein JL720_14559 [Aureococcus anophagefferens]|nr:hypothetical protein JL720_14559 [Aureococcus anophagefferens]